FWSGRPLPLLSPVYSLCVLPILCLVCLLLGFPCLSRVPVRVRVVEPLLLVLHSIVLCLFLVLPHLCICCLHWSILRLGCGCCGLALGSHYGCHPGVFLCCGSSLPLTSPMLRGRP